MSRMREVDSFRENSTDTGKFPIIFPGCTQKCNLSRNFTVWMKGGWRLAKKDDTGTTLKGRIQKGQIRREDVTRRLAELAFGQPNDCVRLALEEVGDLKKLDLSLLSEIKRNEKGMVEIKLIDRLRALEQLAQSTGDDNSQMEEFLQALQSAAKEE